MAGNPSATDVRADKVAAIREILAILYEALEQKRGRGSAEAGGVGTSWSSYEQLRQTINQYEGRLDLLIDPQRVSII